ncbi:MAG: hypothetical protein PHP57_05715 [Sideroxydans sp.]|nr:hypothetical protein [Sideroxydans sp.]
MKTISRSMLFLFTLTAIPVLAENIPDKNIAAQLKALKMEYDVSSAGNFKVPLKIQDRAQLVFIESESVAPIEIGFRKVYTYASVSTKPLSDAKARELFENNSNYTVGYVSTVQSGEDTVVMYSVQIPANADKVLLEDVISIVAGTGDELEMTLTGKDQL